MDATPPSPSPLPSPSQPSRLRLLLDHFSRIEDKRSPEDVAHKLNEILLLCVCATIADCDSFDAIAAWGDAHLDFLRRFLPFDWGVPSGRWLNIMMNRIDPDLFAACFMDWVRACWPDPPDVVAMDGKTVRRSHDRSKGRAALHLVSAFATNSHLVLGQEAVDDKTNETTAIPVLLEKLAAGRSLKGALVTIDAIACNPQIAQSIRDVEADYLLAVKGNQPTLQADIEAAFEAAEKEVTVTVHSIAEDERTR
jgi:predicted transposase YbfD/YdcC